MIFTVYIFHLPIAISFREIFISSVCSNYSKVLYLTILLTFVVVIVHISLHILCTKMIVIHSNLLRVEAKSQFNFTIGFNDQISMFNL